MYKVIRKAISEELAQFVYEYFLMKRKVARKFYDDRYISPFNYDWGVWNGEVSQSEKCGPVQAAASFSMFDEVWNGVFVTVFDKEQLRCLT